MAKKYLNEIHTGNCLRIIPGMPDNSIDLVVTSIPYNTDHPYDLYKDNKPHGKYIAWVESIFKAIYPKLKKGGRIALNLGDGCNGRVHTHVDVTESLVHNLGYLQMSTIIWHKQNSSNRCLPSGELINTSEGYKPIKDVRIGDKVLTHKNRFRKVTEVHKSIFTGNKYTLTAIGSEPVVVYGEHPLYVSPVLRRKNSISKFSPKGRPRKRVPLRPEWKTPSEIEPMGSYLMVSKYGTEYHAGGNSFNERIEKITGVSFNYNQKDFFRLMGYYLGDGSIHRTEVRFDFGPDEEYLEKDVISIASKLGFTFSLEPRENLRRVVVSSKNILPKILRDLCGEYAHTKRLHPFIFQVPYNLQKEIIVGAFHSDGHFCSEQNALVTISECLVYQIRDILIRLKMPPNIYKRKEIKDGGTLKDGRVIRGKHLGYEVRLSGKFGKKLHEMCDVPFDMKDRKYLYNKVKMGSFHAYYRIKEIIKEAVENVEVYNLEVEEDHSYQGKVLYHNCAWGSFKSPQEPSFPTPFEYILLFAKETYALQENGVTDLTKEEFVDWSLGLWTFPKTDYKASTALINDGIHPAPFPLTLPTRLIKMLTWVGATVLDPLAGAGTTCLAAKKLERNYIGIELSKTYADYARQRLRHVVVSPSLFSGEDNG